MTNVFAIQYFIDSQHLFSKNLTECLNLLNYFINSSFMHHFIEKDELNSFCYKSYFLQTICNTREVQPVFPFMPSRITKDIGNKIISIIKVHMN